MPILLLFLLAATACRDAAPVTTAVEGSPLLDLATSFPAAEVSSEVAAIEPGDPDARQHLGSGWSYEESGDDGPYAWGVGERSSLSFFVASPTPFTLELVARPFLFDGAPEQRLTLRLNGRHLAEATLARRLDRQTVAVPASAVIGGTNLLEIDYAYHRAPREVLPGSQDARELAVEWHHIALVGLGAPEAPRLVTAGDVTRLEMPAGTAVTWAFELSGHTSLALPAVDTWGSRDDLELHVRFRTADGRHLERRLEPGSAPRALSLAEEDGAPTIGRLELAVGRAPRGPLGRFAERLTGSRERAHGLALIGPAVIAPTPPEAAAETAAELPARPLADGPRRPNILIYLIDTLRADHLGLYGYDRPTSPQIDRFAEDAWVFEDAQAASSWTRPAVVSVLTGLRARQHGVNERSDALSQSVDTLAEVLEREGYETIGVLTNGNISKNFAVNQGFQRYRRLPESRAVPEVHQLSDRLNRAVLRWLDRQRDVERPFFLYAHATDPHAPYTPPEPFRQRFAAGVDPEIGLLDNVTRVYQRRAPMPAGFREAIIDLYDGEIAFNDHQFGRLLEALRARGLYDDTLIILVADHGEEFSDHEAWGHGNSLYREQIHVPLVVKLPGNLGAGTRSAALVHQIDIVPTVYDVLGLVPPPWLEGRSLIRAAQAPSDDPAISLAYLSLADREIKSVIRRGFKLILDDSEAPRGAPVELYDLRRDAGERLELAAERPFERLLLAQALRFAEHRLTASFAAVADTVEIDAELREKLEALGYLDP